MRIHRCGAFWQTALRLRKKPPCGRGRTRRQSYTGVRNRSRKDIRLTVTPFVQFVSKGSDVEEGQEFLFGAEQIQSGGLTLSIRTDEETEKIPEKEETYFYSYDACDGRRSTGKAKAGCRISAGVRAGEYRELSIVFSVDGTGGQMTAHHGSVLEKERRGRTRTPRSDATRSGQYPCPSPCWMKK